MNNNHHNSIFKYNQLQCGKIKSLFYFLKSKYIFTFVCIYFDHETNLCLPYVILLYFNNKISIQTKAVINYMEIPTKRHLVSIDFKIDEEESQIDAQLFSKKHKLTILVGCTHRSSSKMSVLQNNNQKNRVKKSIGINDSSKYYINRGQKTKNKKIDLRGLTERKNAHNAVTVSLRKDISNDKSYRVHTIEHPSDYNKKENILPTKASKNSNNSLVDITNKKRNFIQISKQNLKKNLINQTELTEITERKTKIIQNKIQQDNIQIVKCPKFNKIRTEIQQQNNQKQKIKYQIKSYKHLLTERNSIADIKSNGLNLITKNKIFLLQKPQNQNQLQKQNRSVTVDLKEKKYQHGKKIKDQFLQGQQQKNNVQKNSDFNNYIDYLHNKKRKESKITRKTIKSILQSRSIIVKSAIIKQIHEVKNNIQENIQSENKKHQKEQQMNQIKQHQDKKQNNAQQLMHELQKIDLNHDLNKFDCSSIPEINQSSFLSESGKKDMIIVNDNTKQNNEVLLQLYETKINEKGKYALQSGNQIIRKKKRKRDSKLSLICRSEMRQAFPQRFFD